MTPVTPPPVILPIPFRDPAAAFAPLAGLPMAVLLDSALPGAQGRYAYIAIDPFRVLRCSGVPWRTSIDGVPHDGDPFETLRAELARYPFIPHGLVPFMGGAVGFFSYELGGILEDLPPPKADTAMPDMVVGLYDTIVAFDLESRGAWVIAQPVHANPAERAARLAAALGADPAPPAPIARMGTWHAETTRADHEKHIQSAIDAIHAGDIYQANVTQRFTMDVPPQAPEPFDVYRHMRGTTPAPFAAYINAGDGLHILSASPERFLKLETDGRVETRPIKGTRPRGADAAEDKRLADALLNSAKDRAENLMIVDLLRNDLARVCETGSIEVPVLCGLESFPAVHHLVSVVTGKLRDGAHAVDLLRAAFPGGSITGAPKIRAMEIIHELEKSPRGPYCGTIAWLGFDGAMDSSIVIRTLIWNGNTLSVQAGGGIVAESVPAQEYEESLLKAQALLNLVGT